MAALPSCTISSPPPWLSGRSLQNSRGPSASLSLTTGSTKTSNFAVNAASTSRSGLLHCSFLSNTLSLSSPFSGLSLGLDLSSRIGLRKEQRRGLVVRAGKKYQLCQTKRNRSRKSLARTHGFRLRMRTTSGRATLKRRRAKGRKVLCTKSCPNSGKGS